MRYNIKSKKKLCLKLEYNKVRYNIKNKKRLRLKLNF